MSDARELSLVCSRVSRAFRALGNALISVGDGAGFVSAVSLAIVFESAVDAAPERRRELTEAAEEFIPIGLEAVKQAFPPDAVSVLSRKLTRAVASFSRRTTQKRHQEMMKNETKHNEESEWLSGVAKLATSPACITALAVSIAFRCALVAKNTCGIKQYKALALLANRIQRLSTFVPDGDIADAGMMTSATLYAASLNARSRADGVVPAEDASLLSDIEECAAAFDAIRLNRALYGTMSWRNCIEAQNVAAEAFGAAFSIIPRRVPFAERDSSPFRKYIAAPLEAR